MMAEAAEVMQSNLQANFSIDATLHKNMPFQIGAVLTFSDTSHVGAFISGNINNSLITQVCSPPGCGREEDEAQKG